MSNRLGKERETDVLPANMEYQNICIYIYWIQGSFNSSKDYKFSKSAKNRTKLYFTFTPRAICEYYDTNTRTKWFVL